jgi:ubiquinone/menaquinone biosynthesis C-methylase UbiE
VGSPTSNVPDVTSDLTRRPTIADVYDQGAAIYAAHWAPVLHRHARDLAGMVPKLQDGEGRTVLDVAAGAGTLLPALRPLAGDPAAGGRLVALDYSAGMLALSDPSVPRVQTDAAALPLRDECADVAVYSFVLFLLPDARAAVTEAARVLRPGGWLLAATWGKQVGTGADVVVEEEVDAADAPAGPDLRRSDELTDTPDRMCELLEAVGFTDITTVARPLDAQFDAVSTLAMRTGSGNLGWRYHQLTPSAQRRVRDRAAARLATLGPDDFLDRSQVQLTTARRAVQGRSAGGSPGRRMA